MITRDSVAMSVRAHVVRRAGQARGIVEVRILEAELLRVGVHHLHEAVLGAP